MTNAPWLETAAKCLKVQVSNSYMWTGNFLITRPVKIDLFTFTEKYRKETLCLTKK